MGLAQDRTQTLADIRAELAGLAAEFNALKAELVSSGAAMTGAAGGDALTRMDTIEAELARLTARTEAVELKLNRVVQDGTNRIGDIEYRLCEVTEGCDLATLGATSVLGGDTGAATAVVPAVPAAPTAGAELAISEQADFDRAQGVLGSGDFRGAADLFATFTQSYPGSPLTQQAHFQRATALEQLGDTSGSARAYLDAFSAAIPEAWPRRSPPWRCRGWGASRGPGQPRPRGVAGGRDDRGGAFGRWGFHRPFASVPGGRAAGRGGDGGSPVAGRKRGGDGFGGRLVRGFGRATCGAGLGTWWPAGAGLWACHMRCRSGNMGRSRATSWTPRDGRGWG